MTIGDDSRAGPKALRTRATGRSYLPSLATTATIGAPNKTADNAPDDSNEDSRPRPNTMANNVHSKKLSLSSMSDFNPLSPDTSRIPRPASRASVPRTRQPLTMEEAVRMAAEKHAAQGSPSPAPRPQRKGSTSSGHQSIAGMFSQTPIDLGRLGNASSRREGTFRSKGSIGSSPLKGGDESDSELDRKIERFEEDERMLRAMKETKTAPYTKRKPGTPASAHRTSGNSIGNESFGSSTRDGPRPTWGDSANHDPNWLRRFQNSPDAAIAFNQRYAGIDTESRRQSDAQRPPLRDVLSVPPRPATVGPAQPPNNAFSWDPDDDFTGGDLQVSNSPAVNYGRPNTRIDELRKLETDAERNFPARKSLFVSAYKNTRLDEILRSEKEAAMRFPIPKVEDSVSLAVDDLPADSNRERPSRAPSNLNGDTDRAGEINNNTRPLPPLENPQAGPRPLHQPGTRVSPKSADHPDSNLRGVGGEKASDDYATGLGGAFRNNSREAQDPLELNADAAVRVDKEPSPAKEDSRDLLRRRAKASSRSPSPSPVQTNSIREEKKTDTVSDLSDKASSGDKDIRGNGGFPARRSRKPAVGFAGISRSSSTNSVSSKHSSIASHDPTNRLDSEMNLFALDNFSERGSLRAPSPLPDVESEGENQDTDETPRPDRIDPTTMPTPHAPGAYVETPAPVKSEQPDAQADDTIQRLDSSSSAKEKIRAQSTSPRASTSGLQQTGARRRSLTERSRSKSATRSRPPIKNSAKPPSVKEDLRQICQSNEIDDTDLDDLTDLIMSSANPEELVKMLKNEQPKFEDSLADLPLNEQLKSLMSGMSESLKTGLASIRTAKKGIERLEDQVSSSEKQGKHTTKPSTGDSSTEKHVHADGANCPACAARAETGPYCFVHLPIPRLYRKEPKFRLTFFGLVLFLFCFWHFWWFVEDIFYDTWGKQRFCYKGQPCHWDIDDPEYGYVIPVKLDEWLTRGMMRPHAARWLEEASDGWADFEEWLTGTNILDINHQAIRDSAKKAQYWRRIEKKGLFPEWKPVPWMLPQIEAWEREMQAQEAADARLVMGYGEDNDDPDESMDKDQHLSRDATNDSPSNWW